jgi:hypothetical protein
MELLSGYVACVMAALGLRIARKKAHEQSGKVFPARLNWPKRLKSQVPKRPVGQHMDQITEVNAPAGAVTRNPVLRPLD